jgi:branched-chain amino acid transport system substrate-binding protein
MQRRRVRVRTSLAGRALVSAAVLGASCVLGLPAVASASTPAPLTIAYITSLTGPGATQTGGSQAGFLARVDEQNAMGGVDGHKLVPLVIDDQTSPTEIVTAVQEAVSKNVIGIVSGSPIFFLAAKYAQQAGMPVTGTYTDGPEWGEKPYTNMFASDRGSVNPKYPVNLLIGHLLREYGGTVVGTYGYTISPLSTASAEGDAQSFKDQGGKIGVIDTTLPFGTQDFGAAALIAKEKGINAVFPSLDTDSNYALAEAFKQAGVDLKSVVFATGYRPSVVHSAAWPNLQGDYFLLPFRPFAAPNAGTKEMQTALEKYSHFTSTQFPSFFQYEGWLGADLMIKGIQMAGPNATHAAIIKDMRSIKSYNGNGLLPYDINYSTIFGHDTQDCVWVFKAEKSGFKLLSSKPQCGSDVPGTASLSSSS